MTTLYAELDPPDGAVTVYDTFPWLIISCGDDWVVKIWLILPRTPNEELHASMLTVYDWPDDSPEKV